MTSLSPPALVLRALLRSLLTEEYSLYIATRSAAQSAWGTQRSLLEAQTRTLDSQLERVAGHLRSQGEWTLVGRSAIVDQLDFAHPSFSGPHSAASLGQRHQTVIQQLHRFTARTSRLGDTTLDALLASLLADHLEAATDLAHDDYPVAQAI